jgi:hypothetical protein
MSFEKPMSNFIDTEINRPEHCRKPSCVMSIIRQPSDKCSPIVDVVNRNVYNRSCAVGYHCNVDGNCVKPQDVSMNAKGDVNQLRRCEGPNDNNCIKEFYNCKNVVIKNPMFGEYNNSLNVCYGRFV